MVLAAGNHLDIFASENLQLFWSRHTIKVAQCLKVKAQLTVVRIATA
jgi:hypothetical protein